MVETLILMENTKFDMKKKLCKIYKFQKTDA